MISFAALVLAVAPISASVPEPSDPLEPLIGAWVGDCTIDPPWQGEAIIPMRWELHGLTSSRPERHYAFTLVYGSAGHDVRRYELIEDLQTTRASKNGSAYILDEHNGITIPHFWNPRARALKASFVVEGNTIEVTYLLRRGRVEVSMITHRCEADSCQILRTQSCSLTPDH